VLFRSSNQNVFLHPQSDDAMQLKESNIAEYEKICKEYGIMVAGIPCGSDEYQLVFIDKFLEELQQEVDRFKEIDKSHAKWAVLKQSISKRIVHFQRGMTPEAIHNTNLIDRYKNILRDMLGDIMKVSSEKIQDHSMAIAWLRTIDGGGGLQYHEDNTLPAYVASYTAALREIVKAYPIVREMVETEMRGEEWDNEIKTKPDKLVQYFNSIKTLTQLGSCIDGKAELVSLEGLWKKFSRIRAKQLVFSIWFQEREFRSRITNNLPTHFVEEIGGRARIPCRTEMQMWSSGGSVHMALLEMHEQLKHTKSHVIYSQNSAHPY